MKIILTGATSPIGNVVGKYLKDNAYDITCIGRDLTTSESQDNLICLTKDSDVFINLAHIGYVQGLLLERSKARLNISFTSIVTQYPWRVTKNFNSEKYVSQKLFLEHVHNSMSNSALISISNYGIGPIPSVSDKQITNAIENIITGKVMIPAIIDVNNGLGGLSLASFENQE